MITPVIDTATGPASHAGASIVERLLDELAQMPANQGVALRLINVLEDPRAGAQAAAAVLAADPVLSTRVLRVANSSYYGLSGRVATLTFAITVLGFDTIRSLAVVNASNLSVDDAPPDFWARSAAVASGASLAARNVGAAAPEAFCAGLLHDLGSALLWRADPDGYRAMRERSARGDTPLPVAERLAYGGTGASLGAQVLAAWHFPEAVCQAIAGRHELSNRQHPPLLRSLQAGLVLADQIGPFADAPGLAATETLRAALLTPADVSRLVPQVRDAAEALVETLVS